MNAIAQALPRVSLPRIYALESKHEFLRLLRSPSFAVPTLMFPPMFYLLFAVLFAGNRGDYHANVYLLATYGVFGVMAPGLFGFGVSVALDRERGWLTLKSAQPMPPGAYLASKLAMAMLFAAIIFTLLARACDDDRRRAPAGVVVGDAARRRNASACCRSARSDFSSARP